MTEPCVPAAVQPHMHKRRHLLSASTARIVLLLLLTGSFLVSTGCGVYFNTFFNARKAFNEGERQRKETKGGSGGTASYKTAIEKSLKVIENYPTSRYYDDALFILASSYYHTREFGKAERRFRELLANYEQSRYADQARLFLARSKLQLGESKGAISQFEEIFARNPNRADKSAAALELALFYTDERKFDIARSYLQAIRDSLGTGEEQRTAQLLIADGHMAEFNFAEGLKGYIQVLGMKPSTGEEYRSLFNAAECSYRLLRVEDGLDYLNRMIDNKLLYDSLGVLKLKVAEGYEIQENLEAAEASYRDIIATVEKKPVIAEAYFRLGLLFQFDYDDLKQAKEYYDKAVENDRGSITGKLAVQHSSDIGKLEKFLIPVKLDSTATQDRIDAVAQTQYQLAELYWFQMNKQDSAIAEMQYLVDSFSTSRWAPYGLVALSQMLLEFRADTLSADSLLRHVVASYPHSDQVSVALGLLGLAGTPADTGYPAYYIAQAERFLIDEQNRDSSRVYYQKVIDRFPGTDHEARARFALIWITEQYEHPGDSSVYLAYQEFADSFPQSSFSREARRILTAEVTQVRPTAEQEEEQSDPIDSSLAAAVTESDGRVVVNNNQSYGEQFANIYLTPDGDSTVLLKDEPIQIEREFELPPEAIGARQPDFTLYFQVKLDFAGKVVDYALKVPTDFDELNRRATETVASMTFNSATISNQISRQQLKLAKDGDGTWFVFKYVIPNPYFQR